jgi:hypothetical protein
LAPVGLMLATLWLALPVPAVAQSGAVPLASHRAIYDLKLAETRGKRPIRAVRGRILYDFSGSACEGYALQFRQVSELDNGEGGTAVSDLRATTWEEGTGKRLRFNSENYLNSRLRDAVDGQAERVRDQIDVKLTKPADKSVKLDVNPVFPTEHVRHVIAAARTGKTILEMVVYDGSESGEKLYDTLAVIGPPIVPGAKALDDATAGQAKLAHLTRWPVTISYFDRSQHSGEQTPVYAITFELYENGISRALKLDYGDFVLSGELTQIELRDVKACP